ncbi:MAG: hypothetical protein WCR52_00970 [Bacteroidota bacterium]
MKINFTYLLLGGLSALYYPAFAQYPGALDPTFGQNGAAIISTPDSVHTGASLAIQSDGKILVSGDISNLSLQGNDIVVTRFFADGSVDPSYGYQGQKRIDILGLYDAPFASATQSDDKLLVAGNSYSNDLNQNIAFVARLNIDGSLDETFGQNGIITFDLGDDEDIFYAIKVLADGKILLGGDTYDKNTSTSVDLLLIRLNPDGSPDTNFGNNGIVKKNFYLGFETIRSLQIQADGKIIAAGFQFINPAQRKIQVERFQVNGATDPSFGNNGVKIIDYGSGSDNTAYSIAVQSDQKIIFCGAKGNANSSMLAVVRLLPGGSFDPDFGVNGQVFTDLGGVVEGKSLLIQPNGKILVGASYLPNPSSGSGYINLLRYLENGALDDEFGANGIVQSPFYPDYVDCSSLALLPNGKILMGATIDLNTVVWRFENDLVATHESNLSEFHINISPNPVDDNFFINWEQTDRILVSADLFDTQGRYIQHLIPPTDFPSGKNEIRCSVMKQLGAGRYFIQFTAGSHIGLLQLVKQ